MFKYFPRRYGLVLAKKQQRRMRVLLWLLRNSEVTILETGIAHNEASLSQQDQVPVHWCNLDL